MRVGMPTRIGVGVATSLRRMSPTCTAGFRRFMAEVEDNKEPGKNADKFNHLRYQHRG